MVHAVLTQALDEPPTDFTPTLGGQLRPPFAEPLADLGGKESAVGAGDSRPAFAGARFVLTDAKARRAGWMVPVAETIGLGGRFSVFHRRRRTPRLGLRQRERQRHTEGNDHHESSHVSHGDSLSCRVQPVAAGAERGRGGCVAGFGTLSAGGSGMRQRPITRRGLVLGAAQAGLAAILASGVAPLALAGGGVRRAANSRLGVGVIGVGIHGRSHLNRALKHPALQVLAVCDVDTTRREASRASADEHYARESPGYSGTRAFVDHRELLEMPGLDAVFIVTPDHWHAIQVIDAARAGRHIYVEKPLSHTLREARAMADAVRASGVVCQVGSQQRTEYSGRFIRAVELVRNGRLGRLVSVQVGLPHSRVGPSAIPCDLPEEQMEPGLDWDRWLGPAPWRPYHSVLSPRGVHEHYPEWRLYREYSGGMITDWGAHHLDIAQWALDRDASGPVGVEPPRNPRADHGARLIYDDGVEVVHGGASGVMFTGEKGWLFVSREKIMASRDEALKEPDEGESFRLPRPADHLADWLDAIETGRRPVADVEVGARTAACCHLLNLAYWHRRPFRWDPRAWRFIDEPHADALMDVPRRAGYELPVH